MKVKIYVKKLGKNRPKAVPITYDYPASIHTVKDLLKETVRINLEAYKKGSQDTDIARVLTKEEIEEQAESGNLETPVGLHEESELTFIRLTMLAGRMW